MSLIVEDDHPAGSFPLFVTLLIAANIVMYVPFAFSDELRAHGISVPTLEYMFHAYGFRPSRPTVPTLFVSLFLHADVLHLLGNMYFLFLFGDNVEDVLGFLLFIVSYLLCGAAGFLLHAGMYPGSDLPCIGASGAISGVAGIYIILFPHVKLKFVRILTMERYEPYKISAYGLMMIWLCLSTFIALYPILSHRDDLSRVAHFGHVGGLLAGIVLGLMFVQLKAFRGFDRLSERGLEDNEPLAPATGALFTDPKDVASAFGSELIFGLWNLLFSSSYRERRVRFWRKQSQSFVGMLLVFLEVTLLVAVAVGMVSAVVLIVVNREVREIFFRVVSGMLG